MKKYLVKPGKDQNQEEILRGRLLEIYLNECPELTQDIIDFISGVKLGSQSEPDPMNTTNPPPTPFSDSSFETRKPNVGEDNVLGHETIERFSHPEVGQPNGTHT